MNAGKEDNRARAGLSRRVGETFPANCGAQRQARPGELERNVKP
jgi:hypothetical protein